MVLWLEMIDDAFRYYLVVVVVVIGYRYAASAYIGRFAGYFGPLVNLLGRP